MCHFLLLLIHLTNLFYMIIKLFTNDSWQERFLKNKKFPWLGWELNLQPLAYEPRTESQDQLDK